MFAKNTFTVLNIKDFRGFRFLYNDFVPFAKFSVIFAMLRQDGNLGDTTISLII